MNTAMNESPAFTDPTGSRTTVGKSVLGDWLLIAESLISLTLPFSSYDEMGTCR